MIVPIVVQRSNNCVFLMTMRSLRSFIFLYYVFPLNLLPLLIVPPLASSSNPCCINNKKVDKTLPTIMLMTDSENNRTKRARINDVRFGNGTTITLSPMPFWNIVQYQTTDPTAFVRCLLPIVVDDKHGKYQT